MQTEFHYRINALFLVLPGCVFQEEAPFCWTPAKTVLSFLFCEVIESLGCKIRQGCKKNEQKKTAPCWIHPAFLNSTAALCNIPMACFSLLLEWWTDRRSVWTTQWMKKCTAPLRTQIIPNLSTFLHCLPRMLDVFSPRVSGRELEGAVCALKYAQKTVLLILSYKGIFKMQ